MAEKFSSSGAFDPQLGPWTSTLAPRFIEFAGVRDGDRVLDVGSGTGPLALALAASTSCSEIVGIDLSAWHIGFARGRTSDPRVRFDVGDAMELPYADGSFDKTLAQLVLNQIPDANRAVAEMCRVTKPGGTVAACVWARGKDNQRNHIFWDAAMAIDPTAAARRETGGRYGTGERLLALWSACGLKEIKDADLVFSVAYASFDDLWSPYQEGQGRSGAYLKSLAPDRQDALRERLRQDILGEKPDGGFSLGGKALAVQGIR